MAICYLGIGSNLGNRKANIRKAVLRIKKLKNTRVLKVSRIIQTDPVGGPVGQSRFLNGALKIETAISPFRLLKELKLIEKDLGRNSSVPCGPRTMDLDILLYADKIIRRKDLIVPHPRMFERDFVLKPLSEVI